MSKGKPSPTQLRALALLAQENATLKGGGFRDTYYRIVTPGGPLGGERITSPTRSAILDYVEPVSDRMVEDTYRLSDQGRLALVEATLGNPARDELLVALERARALAFLMERVVKARSAAGRLSTLYAGDEATMFNYQYGAYMAHEGRAADLLRAARAAIAKTLAEAMRVAGVEAAKSADESAPTPQYT